VKSGKTVITQTWSW